MRADECGRVEGPPLDELLSADGLLGDVEAGGFAEEEEEVTMGFGAGSPAVVSVSFLLPTVIFLLLLDMKRGGKKGEDVLILRSGAEIFGQGGLPLRDDLVGVLERLQSGEDPVAPECELGIIWRGRVRVDEQECV